MKIIKLTVVLILIQSGAQAAVVKQLLNDQNLLVVEFKKNEKIEIGEKFIVSDNKNQCLLEVVGVNKKIATLTSKNCSDKNMLVVGKTIEKSLFDPDLIKQDSSIQANEPTNQVAPVEKIPTITGETYKSFIISYMLSPKIIINATAINGTTSETGSFEFNFTNTVKFGFEWSQFSKNSWNHGFLIDYASLKFDSATVKSTTSGSSTVSLTGGMTILTVAYSGKYLWEQVYLPINLGLASSAVDSTGSFTKTLQTRGFASLGVGFVLSEKFNFELTSNSYTVAASNATSGTTTIWPAEFGYFSNLQLNAKILF